MATSDREVLWDRIVAFMEEEKILAPARLLGLAAAGDQSEGVSLEDFEQQLLVARLHFTNDEARVVSTDLDQNSDGVITVAEVSALVSEKGERRAAASSSVWSCATTRHTPRCSSTTA